MESSKRSSGQKRLTRSLLISVAIGVAGSIVVVPLTYFQMVVTLSHSYVVALTLGLWVIPCLLPLMMVKRPGASLIACGAIGVISATTTPYGLAAIPALLLEGFIVEIPFMVTLYRRWATVQYYLGGVILGGFMGFMVPYTLGITTTDLTLQLGCMGIAIASSLVGTWLCRAINAKVRRIGVIGE